MLQKSFLLLVVLSFAVLPARAQNAASRLPAGAGKDIVANSCTACHALSQAPNGAHKKAEGDRVLHRMVNAGAAVPADGFQPVSDYLAQIFPARSPPPAVIVPGKIEVAIKEWDVPTPGSRPH